MPFLIFLGVVLLLVIYSMFLQYKVRKEGVETRAVVSRIEESITCDSDGTSSTSYTYYATYTNKDSEEVEALLGNPKSGLQEGSVLKVKYLPKRPNYVILVEIINY